MEDYKIGLDKTTGSHKKKKTVCPSCGKKGVFVRYYHFEKGEYIQGNYGRCDREVSCGYHSKPDFKELLSTKTIRNSIPLGMMKKSLGNEVNNSLFNFLCAFIGQPSALKVFRLYQVGTTREDVMKGGSIFWQVDIKGRVRSGKMMAYDHFTGKRFKTGYSFDWVHSYIARSNKRYEGFELEQCFFGEHLLNYSDDAKVAIVESEKTALVCSYYVPDMIWLACGALQGMGGKILNHKKCKPLVGREVVLYPDLSADGKAEAHWSEIARQMRGVGIEAVCENYVDFDISDQDREEGADILDFLTDELKRESVSYVPTCLQDTENVESSNYFPF